MDLLKTRFLHCRRLQYKTIQIWAFKLTPPRMTTASNVLVNFNPASELGKESIFISNWIRLTADHEREHNYRMNPNVSHQNMLNSKMTESSQSVRRVNQVCWLINPIFIKNISLFQTQKQANKKPILSKREATIHVWLFILKFVLH